MSELKRIKELIENTEIIIEKYTGRLPDEDDIVFKPVGLFNNSIVNDITKSYFKRKLLFIEISRPGIYDILPKGLFHNKLTYKKELDKLSDDIENERRQARDFLLPFDDFIYSMFSKIERENLKFFTSTVDPEIILNLLLFYYVFDHINLIEIIEIIIIDICFYQKKDCNGLKNKLLEIFSQNNTFFQILIKLLMETEGKSRLYKFLQTIPYASVSTHSYFETEELLSFILNQPVEITNKDKLMVCRKKGKKLSQHKLNTWDSTFVLGNSVVIRNEVLVIKIFLSSLNALIVKHFLHGAINSLIKCFLSFFIPVNKSYEILFSFETANEKPNGFNLGYEKNITNNFIHIRNEIINKIPESTKEYVSFLSGQAPIELKILIREYIDEFIENIKSEPSIGLCLNINTKL